MNIRRTNRIDGFTIVELLIVVVVIAILAAISVVAYTNIQNRANNSAVEADISAVIKKLELAKVDLGRYPESITEFPTGFKLTKSAYDPTQNNAYYCVDRANDLYAIGLRSKTLRGYIINTGTVTADVGVSGAATCTAIGKTWVNDATTYVAQGYSVTTTTWNTSWIWTN